MLASFAEEDIGKGGAGGVFNDLGVCLDDVVLCGVVCGLCKSNDERGGSLRLGECEMKCC